MGDTNERDALRGALRDYGTHSSDCVAGQYRAGRPTENGGYECLYGYGKDEKWYQRDEEPPCSCGLSKALQALCEDDDE